MLQIMLRLQAQDRPEIPELDTLPGQPLPGITQYIKLMKVQAPVCDAAPPSWVVPIRRLCQQTLPLWFPLPALPAACLVHMRVCPLVCHDNV